MQEDLFGSAKSNEVVASNEDDAVELMMYRQRSSERPEAQHPPEALPDELGPAERGEAPPLREVRKQDKGQLGWVLKAERRAELVLSSVLQVSAKFGDNHRFCNIKVSKSSPSGHDQQSTLLLGNGRKAFTPAG